MGRIKTCATISDACCLLELRSALGTALKFMIFEDRAICLRNFTSSRRKNLFASDPETCENIVLSGG